MVLFYFQFSGTQGMHDMPVKASPSSLRTCGFSRAYASFPNKIEK